MSKILIIGAEGQLAHDLIKVFSRKYTVVKATRKDFDITNKNKAKNFINASKPNIVINTAAYHKTEECELNPEKSFQVNAIGAYNIAKSAAEIGAISVFISTNYVFDGSKKIFDENDLPNPLNVYGASKLAGETLTRLANPRSYILRTSGLFGDKRSGKGHNYVSLMIEKARNGEAIRVVNDEYTSITYTNDLACKLEELIRKNGPFGIYHLVNKGNASWYEISKGIFKIAGLNPNLKPMSCNERVSIVKRPRYSAMKSRKLERIKIKEMRPWIEAVDLYLKSQHIS